MWNCKCVCDRLWREQKAKNTLRHRPRKRGNEQRNHLQSRLIYCLISHSLTQRHLALVTVGHRGSWAADTDSYVSLSSLHAHTHSSFEVQSHINSAYVCFLVIGPEMKHTQMFFAPFCSPATFGCLSAATTNLRCFRFYFLFSVLGVFERSGKHHISSNVH